MPASQTTLSRFASFSARAVGAKTIRMYLSAVRHFHIQEEYVDPLQTTPRLQFVLRSIQRSQKTSHNRPLRRPITLPVLRSLKTSLHLWPQLCRRDKLMYWPAFTTAFFGFMRVSQFTASSDTSFNEQTLRGKKVQFKEDMVVLHLRMSKSDPFHHGCNVVLAPTGGPVCPVRALKQYLAVRWMDVGLLLFCFQSEAFLSRDRLSFQLRSLLNNVGMDSSSYTSHSFLIGAASSAAAAGLPEHLIQRMGRWTSECFKTYVRSNIQVLRSAVCRMSEQK